MTARALDDLLHPSLFPQDLLSDDGKVHAKLCYNPLDTALASRFIRSPRAGANILFLGTTRDSFGDRPVSHLAYQAYPQLALRTLLRVGVEVREKHGLERVIIIHRLGEVPIEEESIICGVSSGHRGEGWKGAEELLERVKERAEIWKQEWFADKQINNRPTTMWKANKDLIENGVGVSRN